jgi:hypothetical protein
MATVCSRHFVVYVRFKHGGKSIHIIADTFSLQTFSSKVLGFESILYVPPLLPCSFQSVQIPNILSNSYKSVCMNFGCVVII